MDHYEELLSRISAQTMLQMKNLFIAGVFSDLTIICGDKRFKVHKNLLWIQSEYFRKLLSGKFKFFELAATETGASSTEADSFLVHVYAIADKYDVAPLRNLAEARLRKIYDPKVGTPSVVLGTERMIAVIQAVDENTPDEIASGKGLWTVLLSKIKAHMPTLLKAESFKKLLNDMPELNFALHAMPPHCVLDLNLEPEDRLRLAARDMGDLVWASPYRQALHAVRLHRALPEDDLSLALRDEREQRLRDAPARPQTPPVPLKRNLRKHAV